MDLDLKQLYKTLTWHDKQRDFPMGEKVGLFILVPEHIAAQFPADGKEGEDSSPPHVTLLYIGTLPSSFEARMCEVVKEVVENFKSFDVYLGDVKKFVNDDMQKVFHSPVKSRKLQSLHEELKDAFKKNQLPFSTKYPEFKPHITIEYVDPGEKRKFADINPEGEWTVDCVWVWGLASPQMYFLK